MVIIESVPNISEGRDLNIINKIKESILSVGNVELKDIHFDYDHNRSVFTIVGQLESVFRSIFSIVDVVIDKLDINNHSGVHPRAGIVDIIPFVPVNNITYEELINEVDSFALSFFYNYKIPVYFYSLSSKKGDRKHIRNKGIEFIKSVSIDDVENRPDIFDRKVFHDTMGVSFIGVRTPLIAFNFNLKTSSFDIDGIFSKAKSICKVIRESGGGIKNVQALPFLLPSKQMVQISTNILNADSVDFIDIFSKILNEIENNCLMVDHTELVGCLPTSVIEKYFKDYLKIKNFSIEKLIDFKVTLSRE
jgi:glutamate formiminotransferase